MDCQIRPWRMEDAPDLALALNNEKIHRNLRDGIPFPYGEGDARAYIRDILGKAPDTAYVFAITVEDRAVGNIGVFRKDNVHFRTAEVGYFVAEPFWGKGICSSGVEQVCRYIFAQTDILRLFAEPYACNTASCRVLEKTGFLCEGILRSNAVKLGQVLDMKLYSRIKGDG